MSGLEEGTSQYYLVHFSASAASATNTPSHPTNTHQEHSQNCPHSAAGATTQPHKCPCTRFAVKQSFVPEMISTISIILQRLVQDLLRLLVDIQDIVLSILVEVLTRFEELYSRISQSTWLEVGTRLVQIFVSSHR